MDSISFVNRIDELLLKQEINRAKLLQDLRMPEATIRSWKRGCLPNVEYVLRIAQYLGSSVEYLIDGKSEGETQPVRTVVVKEQVELPPQEQELIDLYRKMKARDRILILTFARGMCDQ